VKVEKYKNSKTPIIKNVCTTALWRSARATRKLKHYKAEMVVSRYKGISPPSGIFLGTVFVGCGSTSTTKYLQAS